MGCFPSWGTRIAPSNYIDEVKKREAERRTVYATQQASDESIIAMQMRSFYALGNSACAAGSVAIDGDNNSDNYQQSPTNTDNGGID